MFDTVELNVTYYRLPEKKIVKGWVDRTPDGFTFSVKAHRSLTHERKTPDFDAFFDSLEPLISAGKLDCVLAQFPHSFHPTEENYSYLRKVREGLPDAPLVIEFRDNQWLSTRTFELLEKTNMGFCCVDEPQLKGLMPPTCEATSDIAYVRFHGRNAERWWKHDQAWERYDYTYEEDELREWVPRIQGLQSAAPLTLVYANNHYRGQSVDTLRKLQQLLVGTD
jgi:uncharacterized protein YecE (DUF72 family)